MTTLIKQRTGNDCALAAIAMAAGCTSWDQLWSDEDLVPIKDRGVGDLTLWLARAGYQRNVHYKGIYVHGLSYHEDLVGLLWRRRALLSVHSLNNEGNHMVYWDGQELFDPSTQLTYKLLRSLHIVRIVVFDDTVPPLDFIARDNLLAQLQKEGVQP